MQPKLVPLEMLLRWLWEDNPKLHQDVLIQYSIVEHGFNDRVEVCSKFHLVLAGHGRLGNLKRMKDLFLQGDPSIKVPQNIEADEVLGDWLVPCEDHDHFETREQALQYALLNNRAGTTGLDLRDYDIAKLGKALKAAAAGRQMGFELPGFGAEDFTNSSTGQGVPAGPTGATGTFSQIPPANGAAIPIPGQLPKAAIFDPSSLEDAPTYQSSQAPQSYVVMVTAPDSPAFLRVLAALTLGERRNMPAGVRFASVESGKYISEWERYLVVKEVQVVMDKETGAAPLPGQITLAGEVVGETPPLTELALMVGVDKAVAGADQTAVQALELARAREPSWDADGNCPTCHGKGTLGNRNVGGVTYPIFCVECDGAATQANWAQREATRLASAEG